MNSKVFTAGIDSFWADILKHVNDSHVYLDDPAAECLHWYYGADKLFKFGAITVENFSPFVVRKILFFSNFIHFGSFLCFLYM